MRKVIKRREWDKYYYYSRQKWRQKKIKNESPEEEEKKVEIVLSELKNYGMIPHTEYNYEKFLHYRNLVHDNFFVYWTAINPPMERLLYALSEILKPKNILGLGIFTGNPVAWSLGPAIEQEYEIEKLAAVEIDENHARLCDENFKEITTRNDKDGFTNITVSIHARDGFEVLKEYSEESIDLLYLDANGFDPATKKNSKNINTTFLKRGYSKIKPGGYAMCHNAYQKSFRKKASGYLDFTDNEEYFEKTATCAIDEMGLEVSKKIV